MKTDPETLSQHIASLAQFTCESRHRTLPAEVERFGRILLLDTLGALVGGTRYPAVQAMGDLLGEHRLTGSDLPFAALFRLGTAATWLDADSGGSFHPQGDRLPPVPTAHPAPHVLPLILQGAANGVKDDELVRTFVIATEIGMRFGTATSLRPGMHPHGIHGPVGAAVAGGILRGHSAALMAAGMTQALATPVAARLRVPMEGGTVRNAWTGLGTYYGARAAAEAGRRPAIDADVAAAVMSTVVTPEMDMALLTDRLNGRWAMVDSYLKPYACARWIHPALDALQCALATGSGDGSVGRIERVDVETFAFAASLSEIGLRSDLHARFSLPVCIAAMVLDHELHAPGFLPGRLQRPEVRALAESVNVRENREFSAALPRERPTTVTVTWRDGEQTSNHVRNARGNPDAPLTLEEISAKFRSNVHSVLPEELTEVCIATFSDDDSVGRGHRVLAGVATELV